MAGIYIKNRIYFGLALAFLICAAAIPVNAATDKQINDSINLGINWLVSQQKVDGSWGDISAYDVGITGLAVAKLEDRASELGYTNPLDSPYGKNIANGLNYIFKNANLLDQDKIYFITPGSYTRVYETSIAIMAISASTTKNANKVVNVPGSVVNGMTYLEVARKAVNYTKHAQNNDGGWSYQDGSITSDNSNTGYAVLGLDYADKNFFINVDDAKIKLSNWIDKLQCDDGSAGYVVGNCNMFKGILETGNLLYEMALVGDNAGTPRANKAIKFMQNTWNDPSWQPGWKGPGCPQCTWSNYQAMYTTMKGFESMRINEINVAGNPLNWFDDFANAIIKEQVLPDGYWNQTWESDNSKILSTEWALLTLEKTVPHVIIPPTPISSKDPDVNYDSLTVGNDYVRAFGWSGFFPFSYHPAKAENNLEFKKNQQVGSCQNCCNTSRVGAGNNCSICADACRTVNIDQVHVGDRDAQAFGNAETVNNEKIVLNQAT